MVMIVSQRTYDERVSASMCFQFGMLHLLTHSGLGGTQQIFLVTPAMLLKTPPPTPAQLFRVIPEKGPCAA